MGPQPAYHDEEGWETGYIAVAVKLVSNYAFGQQEARSLDAVTQAMAKQPGPCHVAQFEGAFPYLDETTQSEELYIATRCSAQCPPSMHAHSVSAQAPVQASVTGSLQSSLYA